MCELPDYTDTIIIGGGPSSLILSYILHGNIPAYNTSRRHHDPVIHRSLVGLPSLDKLMIAESESAHSAFVKDLHPLSELPEKAYAHLAHSIRYSSQALPINTLLDTLIRPNADTDPTPISCIDWVPMPDRKVDHVVLTDVQASGGQWAADYYGHTAYESANAGDTSSLESIGTLSYAEMLNLPGYSIDRFYSVVHTGATLQAFQRPSKSEVAQYFEAYPQAVGIADTLRIGARVTQVKRASHGKSNSEVPLFSDAPCAGKASMGHRDAPHEGFVVDLELKIDNGEARRRQIRCANIVLATGTFTSSLPPPPSLAPLLDLPYVRDPQMSLDQENTPLLVIGSGFSAADEIISAPADRAIIHIYRWSPEDRPSPLKGCHYQAYPEYAGVYKRMKIAALSSGSHGRRGSTVSPLSSRKREKNPFERLRNWDATYEGLPNAIVTQVDMPKSTKRDAADQKVARILIELSSGDIVERRVCGLRYKAGRRGNLAYLDADLLSEVLDGNLITSSAAKPNRTLTVDTAKQDSISGSTLRSRLYSDLNDKCNLEIAPNVFAIGSLIGDSLVRYAYGGCTWVACKLVERRTLASGNGEIKHRYKTRENMEDGDEIRHDEHRELHHHVHLTTLNGTKTGDSTASSKAGVQPSARLLPEDTSNSVNSHSDLHIDRRQAFGIEHKSRDTG